MIDRSKVVVGLFAVLAAASAIGFGLMFSRLGGDACLDRFGEGAACPALAVVNGTRYSVGVPTELVGVENALTPYAEITRTNVPEQFAELTAYALAGVDPTLALVAYTQPGPGDPPGSYRLMFVTGGDDADGAWPAIRPYLPAVHRCADEECT